MRTTFNIGFVCRPSKTQKSGLAPVEMTIVINDRDSVIVKEIPVEVEVEKTVIPK